MDEQTSKLCIAVLGAAMVIFERVWASRRLRRSQGLRIRELERRLARLRCKSKRRER